VICLKPCSFCKEENQIVYFQEKGSVCHDCWKGVENAVLKGLLWCEACQDRQIYKDKELSFKRDCAMYVCKTCGDIGKRESFSVKVE